MAYDSPQFAPQELHLNNLAGAAGATMTKFLYFAKTRIKKVRALVVTAGTNTVAGIDVLIGTTSVGGLTVGTNTAGTIATATINSDVPADGVLEIKGKATSGTMVLSLSIEQQISPDAGFAA